MKKILCILIISVLVLSHVSCQENLRQRQSTDIKGTVQNVKQKDLICMNEKTIRNYYRELAEVGLDGVTVMAIDKQVEYTDLAIELIYDALKRMGYQSVNDVEARKAIKKYYNIDISENNIYLAGNKLRRYVFKDGAPKERLEQRKAMEVDSSETVSYFWNKSIYVPKYNYIVSYPSIENTVELQGFDNEDADDDIVEKGKLYYSIDTAYFYRNQFIFHDSKAALTWLMNNDRNFLRELFLKYGYDKSDIINKMMIDEVKEEGELPIGKDYKELFVSKGADGRLLIHQGLLQYMLKHADRKNLYYCMLDEYLSSLLDLENVPEFDDLTKEERYKAGAYIGYYYGLMYEKCIGTPCDNEGFGYALYYQKDFISYIKKNNYFHLKDFDRIIQIQYDRYQEGVEIESHRMSGE